MLPLVGIPETVAQFLKKYRNVFCKEAGFQHISRSKLIAPRKIYRTNSGGDDALIVFLNLIKSLFYGKTFQVVYR